jgi:hypothetical protein
MAAGGSPPRKPCARWPALSWLPPGVGDVQGRRDPLRDPGGPDRELTVSLLTGLAEDFVMGTMVPVERSTSVGINGGRGELRKLTDGSWMLQAPLPNGRAFLLQISSAFSEHQVIEVAEGVHAVNHR